jgi:hypothetical protein
MSYAEIRDRITEKSASQIPVTTFEKVIND